MRRSITNPVLVTSLAGLLALTLLVTTSWTPRSGFLSVDPEPFERYFPSA